MSDITRLVVVNAISLTGMLIKRNSSNKLQKDGAKLEYKLFLDTCALLNLQADAFSEHFIISQKTLEEIEHIKTSSGKDSEVKYKARRIAELLDQRSGEYTVVKTSAAVLNILVSYGLPESPDNIILSSAEWYAREYEQPLILVSDDINVKFIAREIFSFEVRGSKQLNIVTDVEEYTGYKEVTFSDEEMSHFYTNMDDNKYGVIQNEYLIVRKSDGEIVDYRKWDGEKYVALSYKQINSHFLGKIKPRNPQQVLAFDMLQNKNETIKVITGRFGSGKDYIMLANALKLIEEGEYQKLIYVRNAVGVKDAEEIGFLPGSAYEKLKPFAMPLADHLGGETGLDMHMMSGTISIEHLGHMRGRDIKNSIVYCTEAENLTKEHIQLLIGRIGEGSSLWINGDFKQTDKYIFRMNSGLYSTIQKLAGHDKFGYVKLQKTERSETAAMADLLD